MRNLDKLKAAKNEQGYSIVPTTSYGQGISSVQTMIVNDDDFIYIYTEKVYILHLIERKSADLRAFTSFTNSPLCALMDGVFQTREAA